MVRRLLAKYLVGRWDRPDGAMSRLRPVVVWDDGRRHFLLLTPVGLWLFDLWTRSPFRRRCPRVLRFEVQRLARGAFYWANRLGRYPKGNELRFSAYPLDDHWRTVYVREARRSPTGSTNGSA